MNERTRQYIENQGATILCSVGHLVCVELFGQRTIRLVRNDIDASHMLNDLAAQAMTDQLSSPEDRADSIDNGAF